MAARVDPVRMLPPPSEMPSLPLVYTSLRAALDDPRASVTRIADILSQDAALTARLLRLVNSAFYALSTPVETVSRAVLLIGTQQIHDLALATMVLRLFDHIPPELVDMPAFWRHALGAGVTARVLAAHRRETNIERFFVAGLLHDIGSLVLYRRHGDACRRALVQCRRERALLVEVEQDVLGTDHAAVGGALMGAWHLSPALREAVAFHHDPGQARTGAIEAAVVHVADVIVHAVELGGSGEPRVPPLDPVAWDRLGLSPGALSAVLDEVDRQMAAATGLLGTGPRR